MRVAVITPPDVVLTVVDARNAGVFTTDDVDAAIEVCIAAAQGTIDGPTGMARAFGRLADSGGDLSGMERQ